MRNVDKIKSLEQELGRYGQAVEDAEFSDALKKGKEVVDFEVENKLLELTGDTTYLYQLQRSMKG